MIARLLGPVWIGLISAVAALGVPVAASALVITTSYDTAVEFSGTVTTTLRILNDSGSTIPAGTIAFGANDVAGVASYVNSPQHCGTTHSWLCPPDFYPTYQQDLDPGQWTDPFVITSEVIPATPVIDPICAANGFTEPCGGAIFFVFLLPSFQTVGSTRNYTQILGAGVSIWADAGLGWTVDDFSRLDWADPANWIGGVPGPDDTAIFELPPGGIALVRVPDGVTVAGLEVQQGGVDLYAEGEMSAAHIRVDGGALTLAHSYPPLDNPVYSTGGVTIVGPGSGLRVVGDLKVDQGVGGGSSGHTSISDGGWLLLQGSASMRTHTMFTASGAQVDVNFGTGGALYVGSVPDGQFGTLADGTIGIYGGSPWPTICESLRVLIGFHLGASAVFSPGCSPGTLEVPGDYSQDSTATLRIEIGASASDRVNVGGTARLGGILELIALDDPSLLQNLEVDFLNAGSVQGTFSEIRNLTGVSVSVDPATGLIQTGGLCAGGADACLDQDGDGVPDASDICAGGDDNVDGDADDVPNHCDACPSDGQNDADGDGACGDVDVCVGGDDRINTDADSLPDFCDACPRDPANDADGDGICGDEDNCPLVANANQQDTDADLEGDVCDDDIDGDAESNSSDNCPYVANDGTDRDGDGAGDACDLDLDGDGVSDAGDACVPTPTGEVVNSDGCSISELTPCAHPVGGELWKNHGAYVSALSRTARTFVESGLITAAEKDAIVSAGGQSTCGSKVK